MKITDRDNAEAAWMVDWDAAWAASGENQDEEDIFPIFAITDSEVAGLALDKMIQDFIDHDWSAGEAFELAMDGPAFCARYFDPYLDEYAAALGLGEDDAVARARVGAKGMSREPGLS